MKESGRRRERERKRARKRESERERVLTDTVWIASYSSDLAGVVLMRFCRVVE